MSNNTFEIGTAKHNNMRKIHLLFLLTLLSWQSYAITNPADSVTKTAINRPGLLNNFNADYTSSESLAEDSEVKKNRT